MATPTPNQPICVIERIKDAKYEPFSPKEYLANICVDRDVLELIYANKLQYTPSIKLPTNTVIIKSLKFKDAPRVPPEP